MNTIIIANITRRDFLGKRIRILAAQKELFPEERRGFPQTYDVTVTWKSRSYACTYRIGSKDGRARSGVLRLKDGLAEAMSEWVGKALKLERVGRNKYELNPVRR
jgi:hypothetical protein